MIRVSNLGVGEDCAGKPWNVQAIGANGAARRGDFECHHKVPLAHGGTNESEER